MSDFKKYLIEADMHDVLWKRWLKALDKAVRIHRSMINLETELERIQKQMRKNGIDAIKNKLDQPIFTDDEDTNDRTRSMVLEQ